MKKSITRPVCLKRIRSWFRREAAERARELKIQAAQDKLLSGVAWRDPFSDMPREKQVVYLRRGSRILLAHWETTAEFPSGKMTEKTWLTEERVVLCLPRGDATVVGWYPLK